MRTPALYHYTRRTSPIKITLRPIFSRTRNVQKPASGVAVVNSLTNRDSFAFTRADTCADNRAEGRIHVQILEPRRPEPEGTGEARLRGDGRRRRALARG